MWLYELAVNAQLMIWRIFSVPVMLRTLLAPWHKDTFNLSMVGGLENLGLAILWNIISRVIGLIFRTVIIFSWVLVESVVLALAVIISLAFLFSPVLIAVAFILGITRL